MAREVVHRSRTNLAPNVPDVPDVPLGPYQVPEWYTEPGTAQRAEWLDLRPPYHPDSGLEHAWSTLLLVPRAMALVFLWLTFHWWRTALALGTVALLFTLWHAG
jgi:hypothetical protein